MGHEGCLKTEIEYFSGVFPVFFITVRRPFFLWFDSVALVPQGYFPFVSSSIFPSFISGGSEFFFVECFLFHSNGFLLCLNHKFSRLCVLHFSEKHVFILLPFCVRCAQVVETLSICFVSMITLKISCFINLKYQNVTE